MTSRLCGVVSKKERRNCRLILSCLLVFCTVSCSIPKWRQKQQPCVLNAGATKDEVIAHLNENISGGNGRPGLHSWRSDEMQVHIDGVPVGLPASIAVQAPLNFRLLVSNPLTRGQEADIGSNPERFWIWSKGTPEILTSSHEDIGLALQELEIPVHIHPDWLMEVFGVVPLEPDEFELRRPKVENGEVELVARRQSLLGEDVERVLRVNVCRGQVTEHLLRLPGGKILARARMEKYVETPGGNEMPMLVKLDWPDAHQHMVIDIRHIETNCSNLVNNTGIWQMPHHGQIVDIGKLARSRAGSSGGIPAAEILPAAHQLPPAQQVPSTQQPGKVQLPDSRSTPAEFPTEASNRPQAEARSDDFTAAASLPAVTRSPRPTGELFTQPVAGVDQDVPEWARIPVNH